MSLFTTTTIFASTQPFGYSSKAARCRSRLTPRIRPGTGTAHRQKGERPDHHIPSASATPFWRMSALRAKRLKPVGHYRVTATAIKESGLLPVFVLSVPRYRLSHQPVLLLSGRWRYRFHHQSDYPRPLVGIGGWRLLRLPSSRSGVLPFRRARLRPFGLVAPSVPLSPRVVKGGPGYERSRRASFRCPYLEEIIPHLLDTYVC